MCSELPHAINNSCVPSSAEKYFGKDGSEIRCQCQLGYTGRLCSIRACTECRANGRCILGVSSNKCRCVNTFHYGENCEHTDYLEFIYSKLSREFTYVLLCALVTFILLLVTLCLNNKCLARSKRKRRESRMYVTKQKQDKLRQSLVNEYAESEDTLLKEGVNHGSPYSDEITYKNNPVSHNNYNFNNNTGHLNGALHSSSRSSHRKNVGPQSENLNLILREKESDSMTRASQRDSMSTTKGDRSSSKRRDLVDRSPYRHRIGTLDNMSVHSYRTLPDPIFGEIVHPNNNVGILPIKDSGR